MELRLDLSILQQIQIFQAEVRAGPHPADVVNSYATCVFKLRFQNEFDLPKKNESKYFTFKVLTLHINVRILKLASKCEKCKLTLNKIISSKNLNEMKLQHNFYNVICR